MKRSGTLRNLRGSAALTVLGVLMLACPGHSVQAQLRLERDLVCGTSVNAEGEKKIQEYIDRSKTGLSGDAIAISAARKQLLLPLSEACVSSAFRLKYSDLLQPDLAAMLASKNIDTSINAARILGELATPKAADSLVPALQEERPRVRLVAAQAFKATFETAIGERGTALGGSKASQLLSQVDSAFRKETDPAVADALISAMDAAAGVTAIPTLRADAVRTMAAAIQAKARDSRGAEFVAAYARAGQSMFDLVKDPTIAGALSEDTKKEMGGLAGDLLAHALRRRGADPTKLSAAECADLQVIVRIAENLYVYVHKDLRGQPTPLNLEQSLCAPSDNFRKDVLQLIGSSGVLTRPPFGFPADRFK